MMMTLIVTAALLAGSAVLVSLQVGSNRGAELTRSGLTALYCAEAGISAARSAVAANYAGWAQYLGTNTEPSWLSTIDHDVDDDGADDFAITLRDNHDEGTANDPTKDNDLQVFVASTCIKFPETAKQLVELVRVSSGGNCYNAQLGGCGANGNAN